jgi:Na+-translocating ferredoxin:NAD+ oxidoreductase RnfC subunit
MAKELKKRGVKGPSRRSDIQVRKGYNNNRVSLSHLRKRIGVEQYEKKVMPLKEKKTPAVVRIPLLRHVGRPARPIVFEGQDVQMGDVIAFSPPSEMGTTCHASISGKVGEVNENWIEIVKGRKS